MQYLAGMNTRRINTRKSTRMVNQWLLTITSTLLFMNGTGIAQANSAPGPSGPIKVLELNFNSEEVPNDSDSYVRDLRYNGLKRWITENDPDIILMAEGWNYRGDPTVGLTVARAMGYDLAYRLEMGLPKFFYDADAILTKKSLHMTGERDIKLPHSALEIGNGKTWIIEFGDVSYAVGVKLTLGNGEPLYVYTCHLTASSANDRSDQARAIDADARKRTKADGIPWAKAHVIIGGDFNSTPTDPASKSLTSLGYEDSFGAMHPGDNSCSDCSDLSFPWFNPFTVASGLFPSQASENTSLRDDYIWSHSPTFKALSSTLVFTAPFDGVWMSDHYGVSTVFGDSSVPTPPNPSHDSDGTAPPTQIVTITTDQFLCPGGVGGPGCDSEFAPVVVNGPRGLTIANRSDFYFEVDISGPGFIFASQTAALNSGEQASFTFNTLGEFTYTIKNTVESPNPYRAELKGSVQVEKTGY
jgi:hypothetical protein